VKADDSRLEIKKEFSRFAHSYDTYNIIQQQVSRELIHQIPQKKYMQIVDIGSGSGSVYKQLKLQNISLCHFVALDASEAMLSLHPSSDVITKICGDFDCPESFENIESSSHTLVLSSSSLQWSRNLLCLIGYIHHIF